jgi:hypothetical protein
MVMTKIEKTYALKSDIDHLEDKSHEAWIDSDDMFEGWEYVGLLLDLDGPVERNQDFKVVLPKKISMQAFFDYLEDTDFPVCEPSWPIMSKRMIETLRSVGKFKHTTYPITMMDSNINPPDINNIENHDYEIIHIHEQLDVINHEKSDYRISSLTNSISFFRKLVLNTPPDGFPPVFRIVGYTSIIFISHDAKIALEKAGIKGLEIIPSDNFHA